MLRSKLGRERRLCLTSLKRKTMHYKDRWTRKTHTRTLHILSTSVVHSLLFSLIILKLTYAFSVFGGPKVTQLTDKLKNQSESNKQAQDNLHEQVQEQKTLLRSAQDRASTLETSVNELTTQLADSKEKLSQLDAQVCSTCLKNNDIFLNFASWTGPEAASPKHNFFL